MDYTSNTNGSDGVTSINDLVNRMKTFTLLTWCGLPDVVSNNSKSTLVNNKSP
jgi:hypothetical protein